MPARTCPKPNWLLKILAILSEHTVSSLTRGAGRRFSHFLENVGGDLYTARTSTSVPLKAAVPQRESTRKSSARSLKLAPPFFLAT